MKKGKEYKETTNRSVYNKVRKQALEAHGDIRCTWCAYHKNENSSTYWYGGFDSIDNVRIPNWKLVSKNSKQWMDKPIKISEKMKTSWRGDYIFYEITW